MFLTICAAEKNVTLFPIRKLSQLGNNANIVVDKIPQTKNRIWSLLYFCTYPNPWQADFG
jgi:hypothetical protein